MRPNATTGKAAAPPACMDRMARRGAASAVLGAMAVAAAAITMFTAQPAQAETGSYKFISDGTVRQFQRTGAYLKVFANRKVHWYRQAKDGTRTVYRECSVPADPIGAIAPSKAACAPFKPGTYRFLNNGVAVWSSGNTRITLVRSSIDTYGWTGGPIDGVYSETGQRNPELVREFRTLGSVNEHLQYRYYTPSGGWTEWGSYTLIGDTTYVNDRNTRQFTFSEDLRTVTWAPGDNSGKRSFSLYLVDRNPEIGQAERGSRRTVGSRSETTGSEASAREATRQAREACGGIPLTLGGQTVCIGG